MQGQRVGQNITIWPLRKCKRNSTELTPTPLHSSKIPSSLHLISTSSATEPHKTSKSTSASTPIHARLMNQPNRTILWRRKMHQSTKPQLSYQHSHTPPKFSYPFYFSYYVLRKDIIILIIIMIS